MTDTRLVYSTQSGRICPNCRQPSKACSCKKRTMPTGQVPGDGILHIRRERKGRHGKTVTTVTGFNQGHDQVKQIASRLKNQCGTGGAVKDGMIIIQGDHRSGGEQFD